MTFRSAWHKDEIIASLEQTWISPTALCRECVWLGEMVASIETGMVWTSDICIVIHVLTDTLPNYMNILHPWLLLDWTRLRVSSALRGVPPNLIVTFPCRTRWHLVDVPSSIILSGKWLFLISSVMVYSNSEGLGEGKVWKTKWNISASMYTIIHIPGLFSCSMFWVFHISKFNSFPDVF